MLNKLKADLWHYARYCYHGKQIWRIMPRLLLAHPAVVGVIWYRLGKAAWQCRFPLIKQLFQMLYFVGLPFARIYSGVQIHLDTDVEPGLAILHFGGVVIAPGTRIGPNCLLHHNVCLVTYRDAYGPEIGASFYAGTGATVVDNVIIEDNVTVGAGCVITKSVPRNAIVAGAPARFIRFRRPGEVPSENKTLSKRLTKEWITVNNSRDIPD